MPGPSTYAIGSVRNFLVLRVNVGTQASVGANTTVERQLTVPGVMPGDMIFVVKPTAQAGLAVGQARVSANDTVQLTYINASGGGVTPTASELYLFAVIRHDYPDQSFIPSGIM